MPRLPLIDDLTTGQVPAGSNLLVEYDPSSQWFAASLTIAAGLLKSGGTVSYNVVTMPPDEVRVKLNKLGLNVEELERNGDLRIIDWYSLTLGRKPKEKQSISSLKIPDLSIQASESMRATQPEPNRIIVQDDLSFLARFNDERTWVEFSLSRDFPEKKITKITQVFGILRGVHSEWVYNRLEAAVDGVIDFKLDETMDPPQNLMRVRMMRNVGFDGRWHRLKVGENFEVALEK